MRSTSPAIHMQISSLLFLLSSIACQGFTHLPRFGRNVQLFSTVLYAENVDPMAESAAEWYNAELLANEDGIDEDDEEDEDWQPDREKARQKRKFAQDYYAQTTPERVTQVKTPSPTDDPEETKKRTPVYTEEEEELILAMGGKTGGMREPGFLGDSTLGEIARDYSVPVCYIADVLCTWGVPVPINVNERLGDMVTGEQAFAVLEAIHTLDVSALQDRYSNNNLVEVCDYYDIDMRDAFQMAVKEGWSVPFGVQTCLRVEQEEELLRVLGGSYTRPEEDE